MIFNANRIAKLAGVGGGRSGLLSEAGNRSKREEQGLHYKGSDWYENDLNEDMGFDDDMDLVVNIPDPSMELPFDDDAIAQRSGPT